MTILIRALAALTAVIAICFTITTVQADVGVGIMPGKIQVEDSLMPGGLYHLPSLQVANTGDQATNYELALARMEKQDELSPTEEFFSFSPESFRLDPGASQVISLSLNVPVNAIAGDYLAYIEAHPVSAGTAGTSIGVAAATKVYFTVKPASTWAGIVNYAVSFLKRNAPLSYILPGVILAGLLLYWLRRRIKLEVKLTRK